MTAKEYLSRYRNLDREIDCLMAELSRLRTLMYQTGGGIDGMPRGRKGQSGARYEGVVDKHVEVEQVLDAKVDQLADVAAEISRTISQVQDATLRRLLQCRYLSHGRYDWRCIARTIRRGEVNTRGRLHRSALEEVKKIISQDVVSGVDKEHGMW